MEVPFQERREKIAARVSEAEVDAAWITGLVNVRYLTGFTGSFGQLLVTPTEVLFFTDGRYEEQAHNEVSGCQVHVFKNQTFGDVFSQEITQRGWKSIGYETRHLTCDALQKQRSLADDGVKWKPVSGWTEELRVFKDASEIEFLKQSSQIVDKVFEELLPSIKEGVTEQDVLRKMMNLFWEAGAKGPSFDPIVLFGSRTSLPHGQPSDAVLREGNWVLLDFGAYYKGYCSDCTRTFFYGSPDSLQRERHHLVMTAYRTGLTAARPGMACCDVDAAARKVFEQAGLGEAFLHGLGHGVGLEIHEGPRVARPSRELLYEGMAVTIEPGIYLPGWGGIRLENAVVITADGAEPFTFCDMSIDPWQK
jgi:Xaa-Pro aminopeptidase